MKINELLSTATIDLTLSTPTKEATIEALAQLLYEADKLTSLEDFKAGILERESLGSTRVGYGIAIPHAKTKVVKTPALAYGYHKEGVDYDSLDEAPAHLIFMIAAPEGENNLHLQTLAKLSRQLIDEDFREALHACKSKEEVLTHLSKIDKEEA